MKVEIPWPHQHCFPSALGKYSRIKLLVPIQFIISFLGCIQEAQKNTVSIICCRMVAISFRMPSRQTGSHLVMHLWSSCRTCNEERSPGDFQARFEKIQIQNTARVISARTNPPNTKDNKDATKDMICEDFNKNDRKFSSDHVFGSWANLETCLVLLF